MTMNDLFFTVAMVCLILLTGFACTALFYIIQVFRVWSKLSRETEEHITRCVEKFHDVLHSFVSMKNVFDIGLQALQTVAGAYKSTQNRRAKKNKPSE